MFKEWYSFERSDDNIYGILIRVAGFFLLGFAIYAIFIEAGNLKTFGIESFDDIYKWGSSKIEGKGNEIVIKSKIPNLADIIKEEQNE